MWIYFVGIRAGSDHVPMTECETLVWLVWKNMETVHFSFGMTF
jgi:hypothetical protein